MSILILYFLVIFQFYFHHKCQLLVFISQLRHLISLFTIVHTLSTSCKLLLGTYAWTATNPQPELHFSSVIFLANLPNFQYNYDIGAFWHLLLYMQAIFSHLTGSCDSLVQFFRWFPWPFSYLRTQKVNAKTLNFLFIF